MNGVNTINTVNVDIFEYNIIKGLHKHCQNYLGQIIPFDCRVSKDYKINNDLFNILSYLIRKSSFLLRDIKPNDFKLWIAQEVNINSEIDDSKNTYEKCRSIIKVYVINVLTEVIIKTIYINDDDMIDLEI